MYSSPLVLCTLHVNILSWCYKLGHVCNSTITVGLLKQHIELYKLSAHPLDFLLRLHACTLALCLTECNRYQLMSMAHSVLLSNLKSAMLQPPPSFHTIQSTSVLHIHVYVCVEGYIIIILMHSLICVLTFYRMTLYYSYIAFIIKCFVVQPLRHHLCCFAMN